MSIYEGPPSVGEAPEDTVAVSQPAPRSGLAIASTVCSVLWLWGLGSLAGVVLGHLARRDCERDGMRGGGFRVFGLLLGYIGIIATLVVVLGGGSLVFSGAPDGTADPTAGYSAPVGDQSTVPGMFFGG